MSLWSSDEHRIVLSPRRVLLARLSSEFTRRGVRRRVSEIQEAPCPLTAGDETPWSGALKTLEKILPEPAGRRATASVILSNHFMRYALIPWSDALNDAREELAFAQHTFSEMYGRDAATWELRMSAGKPGMPQMACAADVRLLDAVRETCGRVRIRLKSVQPHLMLAYNACLASLRGRSGWLVLVEQGNLCLALLHEGQWSWVRMMRVGGQWQKELPFLLNRESLVANVEGDVRDVFLWAPEHKTLPMSTEGQWHIRSLHPPLMSGLTQQLKNRGALYLSE